MADEPSWNEIFGADATPAAPRSEAPAPQPAPAFAAAAPDQRPAPTRRDAHAEHRAVRRKPPRERHWGILIIFLIFVLVVAGGGTFVWTQYGARIEKKLGIGGSDDYSGSGNGTKVTVVIQKGDIGSQVAQTLHKDGVTKTYTAVYSLLLKEPSVSFEPGNYGLQKQMSAKSAIAALQNAKNRIVDKVTIPEGSAAESIYALLAPATHLTVADYQAAAKNYVALGVPAQAPSIEGFLFPATYDFTPGETATQVLQTLVTTMLNHLKSAGVAPANYFSVVTLASIVQKESGPSVDDMHKIARVFQNRLDAKMALQSDATVAYGSGSVGHVTTTDAQRADASDPYNTYAHTGLPVGPIGNPGDSAIDSALHPTAGPWLYFVAVNLKTGETVFSTTLAEHQAAVKQFQAWCQASTENMSYCG